jgi:uncharacterized protein YcfJ
VPPMVSTLPAARKHRANAVSVEHRMNARAGAWIAICVILGAVFAGAIAEGMGASHTTAVVVAVLGGALGALVARYIG